MGVKEHYTLRLAHPGLVTTDTRTPIVCELTLHQTHQYNFAAHAGGLGMQAPRGVQLLSKYARACNTRGTKRAWSGRLGRGFLAAAEL